MSEFDGLPMNVAVQMARHVQLEGNVKGKYATRAANRREAAEVEQSEAAYRRQIVRLSQERDEARRERDESRRLHQQEVRVLAARLAEVASPRVEALTRELERQRGRADRVQRDLGEWMKARERFASILADTLAESYRLARPEGHGLVAEIWACALPKAMMYLAGPSPRAASAVKALAAGRMSTDQEATFRRALVARKGQMGQIKEDVAVGDVVDSTQERLWTRSEAIVQAWEATPGETGWGET